MAAGRAVSPDQPEVQATEIVELLEAGDADGVRVHLTPELQARMMERRSGQQTGEAFG